MKYIILLIVLSGCISEKELCRYEERPRKYCVNKCIHNSSRALNKSESQFLGGAHTSNGTRQDNAFSVLYEYCNKYVTNGCFRELGAYDCKGSENFVRLPFGYGLMEKR